MHCRVTLYVHKETPLSQYHSIIVGYYVNLSWTEFLSYTGSWYLPILRPCSQVPRTISFTETGEISDLDSYRTVLRHVHVICQGTCNCFN